jgi:hypothetical protein
MADPPKKGIFKDPWRSAPVPTAPLPSKTVALPSQEPIDNAESLPVQSVSATLPNYGGITVLGTGNPQELGRRVLEFCVQNAKIVEPYLLQYSIVIVRLPLTTKLNTPFYIQRSDGWTLAVPDVTTKEQGLLQLIQAFLELTQTPNTRTLLEQAGIRPYKQ